MSSPFSSALAQLDSNLQAIQRQVDRLQAGLLINEEQLGEALEEACHHSASLRELIRAENPDADWKNRDDLDQLIHGLEIAAAARRNQQRRNRLLELAMELDAGAIKHRFESRTATLNELRRDAVKELRTEAALPEQTRQLPGPEAYAWLSWACTLDDEKDAVVLANLRRDFPALERFTAEMDESYWIPPRRVREATAHPPEPPAGAAAEPSAEPPATPSVKPLALARTDQDKTSENLRDRVVKAMHSGQYAEALELCYEPPSTETQSGPESRWVMGAANEWQAATATVESEPSGVLGTARNVKRCLKCGSSFPAEFHFCPFDDSPLVIITDTPPEAAKRESGAVPSKPAEVSTPAAIAGRAQFISAGAMAATLTAESAVVQPLQRSLATTQPESAEPELAEPEAPADETLRKLEVPGIRKRLVIAWAGGAGFILLSVLFFALIYHFYRPGSEKTGQSATNLPADDIQTASAAAPQPAGPDAPESAATNANVKTRLLHKQPAEGPQDKILLSVELCGRGHPGNIECWGYVSNLGSESSRVSLDRVDVVDGRGNSFSRGQSAFPAGHTFDVPAGSSVKFSVDVPDNDQQARTLTLYMDLSNPRNLEYTFRDVPVAE